MAKTNKSRKSKFQKFVELVKALERLATAVTKLLVQVGKIATTRPFLEVGLAVAVLVGYLVNRLISS